MPKKDADTQLESQKSTTADLSVSQDGHALTITMDLSCMARMRATVTSLKINDGKISITIKITNLSSLELSFGSGCFLLKKGRQTVGELFGSLDIVPGKFEVEVDGNIEKGASGMVTLEGESDYDCEQSWSQYAIRLFKVEINLDELDDDSDGK